MKKWTDLFENQSGVYIRFGEIPENERSGIGKSPNWIYHMQRTSDEEEGVSVYYSRYQVETDQWVIEDCGNYASLGQLIDEASEGKRNIYIVSGREVGLGADGEPLIRDVKIIKKINSVESLLAPGFFDGKETVPTIEYRGEITCIYSDGTTKREPLDSITVDEIDEFLGPFTSINGLSDTNRILFRTLDTEGKPENEMATQICSEILQQEIDPPLRGNAVLITNWTKEKVIR